MNIRKRIKDLTLRSYEYQATVPYIFIREVIAESPIYSGEIFQIDIHYDLTGTIAGEPFPTQLKVVEKGPDVSDHASGEYELATGEDQVFSLWFWTSYSTKGLYKFTFELKVPPNSWKMPQVSSKGKCSVQVKEPPDEEMSPDRKSLPRRGGNEEAVITH